MTQSLPPRSKRSQLGNILSMLAKLSPKGETNVAKSLHQVAGMIRHRSLVMLFSDLLGEPAPILRALHRLRHAGHDVIIFHILDEAEALFPFEGMLELEDNETHEPPHRRRRGGSKADYTSKKSPHLQCGCTRRNASAKGSDYVPLHTGVPFDKALMSYLLSRQARGDRMHVISKKPPPGLLGRPSRRPPEPLRRWYRSRSKARPKDHFRRSAGRIFRRPIRSVDRMLSSTSAAAKYRLVTQIYHDDQSGLARA